MTRSIVAVVCSCVAASISQAADFGPNTKDFNAARTKAINFFKTAQDEMRAGHRRKRPEFPVWWRIRCLSAASHPTTRGRCAKTLKHPRIVRSTRRRDLFPEEQSLRTMRRRSSCWRCIAANKDGRYDATLKTAEN